MIKLILIGIKDLKIIFRDRAALVFMLLTPFLLTIGMGLVTGRFSNNDNSNALNIPIVIVNLDNDVLGNAIQEIFTSQDLAEIVKPTVNQDEEAARLLVDQDEITAAIIIPENFTQSIFNPNENQNIQIEFYANPSRPTSSGIVKSLLDNILSRIEEEKINRQTVITQLISTGRITPQEIEKVNSEIKSSNELAIKINTQTSQAEAVEFDLLSYFAPAMALMFLMYTVSYGGRSILAEKSQGTLPRLLISPTNSVQILGGKIFGIFLTGAAQVFILIGATTLFFQLQWGNALGVIVLVISAVFGATGWGLLITALARTPSQVGSIGTAVMLIFGILGGGFFEVQNLPAIAQTFSKITPNAWALDGFTTLAFGGSFASLTTPVLALLTMGIVLFSVSAVLFGKKSLVN